MRLSDLNNHPRGFAGNLPSARGHARSVGMSNTPTCNVSLTAELFADIHVEVTSGYYSDASEVVCRQRLPKTQTGSVEG
jgi:hypothetical protein